MGLRSIALLCCAIGGLAAMEMKWVPRAAIQGEPSCWVISSNPGDQLSVRTTPGTDVLLSLMTPIHEWYPIWTQSCSLVLQFGDQQWQYQVSTPDHCANWQLLHGVACSQDGHPIIYLPEKKIPAKEDRRWKAFSMFTDAAQHRRTVTGALALGAPSPQSDISSIGEDADSLDALLVALSALEEVPEGILLRVPYQLAQAGLSQHQWSLQCAFLLQALREKGARRIAVFSKFNPRVCSAAEYAHWKKCLTKTVALHQQNYVDLDNNMTLADWFTQSWEIR